MVHNMYNNFQVETTKYIHLAQGLYAYGCSCVTFLAVYTVAMVICLAHPGFVGYILRFISKISKLMFSIKYVNSSNTGQTYVRGIENISLHSMLSLYIYTCGLQYCIDE